MEKSFRVNFIGCFRCSRILCNPKFNCYIFFLSLFFTFSFFLIFSCFFLLVLIFCLFIFYNNKSLLLQILFSTTPSLFFFFSSFFNSRLISFSWNANCITYNCYCLHSPPWYVYIYIFVCDLLFSFSLFPFCLPFFFL